MGGVEIPNQKRIEFSLQYVFGVGPTTAKAILADTVGFSCSMCYLQSDLALWSKVNTSLHQ